MTNASTAALSARHAVELSVEDTADKGVPFRWSEVQDTAPRVLAVAYPNRVIGQARDLDAIAVIGAERALNPGP